jgi:hypothetical protein
MIDGQMLFDLWESDSFVYAGFSATVFLLPIISTRALVTFTTNLSMVFFSGKAMWFRVSEYVYLLYPSGYGAGDI